MGRAEAAQLLQVQLAELLDAFLSQRRQAEVDDAVVVRVALAGHELGPLGAVDQLDHAVVAASSCSRPIEPITAAVPSRWTTGRMVWSDSTIT